MAFGPTTVPGPSTAEGWTCAEGWIVAALSTTATCSSASAATWPATLATADRRAIGPRRRRTSMSSVTWSPGVTWRRNFVPVTRRSTVRALRTCSPSYSSSSVAACVSDSIRRTPGIRGTSGKCPWKNVLVDRHVLDRRDPLPRLDDRHRVHEPDGIAVAEAVEDRGDVHRVAGGGHGYFFGAAGAGFGAAALAASSRRITSAVRSSPPSAHTRPESAWLKSSWSPFSRATASITGPTFR